MTPRRSGVDRRGAGRPYGDVLDKLDERIVAQAASVRLVATMMLLVIVAALDYLTGSEISFSIFYLTPVAFGTWYVGARTGVFAAVTSAAVWLYLEMSTGRGYQSVIAPYWNSFVRFGFFMITLLLITQIKRAGERERDLARTDSLTGVANARAFQDRSSLAMAEMRRTGLPLTLAYIDLDRFKAVNDVLGHSEGDEVLKTVASVMSARLRGTDVVARLGGDEFGILMPATDTAGACRLLSELATSVADAVGGRWDVGQTVGAVTMLDAPLDSDQMVRLADDLMYRGKRAGRGCVLLAEWTLEDGLSPVQEMRLRESCA